MRRQTTKQRRERRRRETIIRARIGSPTSAGTLRPHFPSCGSSASKKWPNRYKISLFGAAVRPSSPRELEWHRCCVAQSGARRLIPIQCSAGPACPPSFPPSPTSSSSLHLLLLRWAPLALRRGGVAFGYGDGPSSSSSLSSSASGCHGAFLYTSPSLVQVS